MEYHFLFLPSLFLLPSFHMVRSLSDDDGDGNKNGRSATCLGNVYTALSRRSAFLSISPPPPPIFSRKLKHTVSLKPTAGFTFAHDISTRSAGQHLKKWGMAVHHFVEWGGNVLLIKRRALYNHSGKIRHSSQVFRNGLFRLFEFLKHDRKKVKPSIPKCNSQNCLSFLKQFLETAHW